VNWVAAFALLILVLYLLIAAVNSSVFHLRNTLGTLCESSDVVNTLDDETVVELDISNACFATGIKLEADKTYHLSVADTEVNDGPYVADADGIKQPGALMYMSIPLRRHITKPWINLFGRIGHDGNDNYVLAVGNNQITARSDGELFLYVNDAVLGVWPRWDLPYVWKGGKNTGSIAVTVDVEKSI
jgi:hypothetical protein